MSENRARRLVLALLGALLVLVIAVIGTFVALYFLSATPTGEHLRSVFGLKDLKTISLDDSRTLTERVVVEESSAVIDASKKVNPAVVTITSTGKAVRDPFGFGVTQQAPTSSGSGFIVTSDGLVATNKHVVDGGENFRVTTTEGKTYDGKVVGIDPVTDLALVKIEARGLPVADLGDSDKIQVGQWVIAIGNALGELQNTVTVGVISAKERKAQPTDGQGNTESLDGLFQTDAAINPGNSGGPLLNLKGQVIGINTAVAATAQNIGFAIPINELKKSLESYRANGKIVRPYIGVRYQSLTSVLAKTLELSVEEGALVTASGNLPAIVKDSPADKAGLKDGDIITKVDDKAITETNPLARIIRTYSAGDKVTLTILRDKKSQTVELTLGELGK
jgi:S1-C subfamily serine protease